MDGEINKKEAEDMLNSLLQIVNEYFLKEKFIRWKINFMSPPSKVYQYLNTDEGRAKFWADSAIEKDGIIEFKFPSGYIWLGKILAREPNKYFSLNYIDNTKTSFQLEETETGGTDLEVQDKNVHPKYYSLVKAGWVTVLMNMKAAVDHGIDLRNHDPKRSWDHGYVDN